MFTFSKCCSRTTADVGVNRVDFIERDISSDEKEKRNFTSRDFANAGASLKSKIERSEMTKKNDKISASGDFG